MLFFKLIRLRNPLKLLTSDTNFTTVQISKLRNVVKDLLKPPIKLQEAGVLREKKYYTKIQNKYLTLFQVMTAVNIFSLGNDLVGNVSEYTEHMVI